MNYIKYIFNLPWTVICIILSLLSFPTQINFKNHAILIHVLNFWWHPSRGVRAITLGNAILLGNNLEKHDIEHEFIHIEQHMRRPFIHPFLAAIELAMHGSKDSRYEKEAYKRAGNKYFK